MQYQTFITSVLEEASRIANEKFGNVSGVSKGNDNNQVLTEADIAIGNLIIEQIKQHYPDYNIIDEEAGVIDNRSEYTWVIDPIDGTSNFAHGVPTYGIMLGLLQNDTPIAGGAALPAFSTVVTAEKGEGAFSNGNKIQVTKEEKLLHCLVAYQIDGHQENPQLTYDESKILADIILGIRNLRTAGSVFDLMQVAQGNYGGVLMNTSKIWDNVAPHIIIEEAGGLYTDFKGNPVEYSKPLSCVNNNYTFCAASPLLHQQLQEIIHNS